MFFFVIKKSQADLNYISCPEPSSASP